MEWESADVDEFDLHVNYSMLKLVAVDGLVSLQGNLSAGILKSWELNHRGSCLEILSC